MSTIDGVPRLVPRLTVRAIQPIVEGLRSLGHDPDPVLRALGISCLMTDPDEPLSMDKGFALAGRLVEITGDPDIGLHLAETVDLGVVGVPFYALMASPSLGDGFERLCRYQRLINDTTQVTLHEEDSVAILRHYVPGGADTPRQTAEFIVAAWVRGGRMATDREWAPLEVRFRHAVPDSVSEHTRFFRSPVRFSAAENALALDSALLRLPCAGANPSLLAVMDRYAVELLERTPASASLSDRAHSVLAKLLRAGTPGASQLAARLRMSVRTLNRALAAEGTSYRILLQDVRHQLAARLLSDPRVSISEAAFLTGFSELSTFHRAFKQWTGKTPRQFRLQSRR